MRAAWGVVVLTSNIQHLLVNTYHASLQDDILGISSDPRIHVRTTRSHATEAYSILYRIFTFVLIDRTIIFG